MVRVVVADFSPVTAVIVVATAAAATAVVGMAMARRLKSLGRRSMVALRILLSQGFQRSSNKGVEVPSTLKVRL